MPKTPKEKPQTSNAIVRVKHPHRNGPIPCWNDEQIRTICDMISEGKHLVESCEKVGISARTFNRAILSSPDVYMPLYAYARELKIQRMEDELLKIADDGLNDTYVDENGNVRTDHDVVNRSRLRVDTRKWIMSKVCPKKYGDRQEVEATVRVLSQQLYAKEAPVEEV